MARQSAESVSQPTISSVDISGFSAGLYLNGAQNAPTNAFTEDTKDVELTINGLLAPRRKLVPFLPDTVETTYQKAPIYYNGVNYYFTLDNGKAVFCKEGDVSWTSCTGTNTLTTNAGGKPIFLRVLNNVLILNGTNGDKLAYVDLTQVGFPVVKFTKVNDPTSAPTATLKNLTTDGAAFTIYYAYTWSGAVGETMLSPILSQKINIVRDQWQNNTANPSSITISRPAAPTGARKWNLYVAVAATAGTIQPSDMLQLASGLDLATTTFVDDGTLSINLGSVPPTSNATDGPRVSNGIVEEGNPILIGDVDNPYNVYIGGGGPNAMKFDTASNGYLAQPQLGTNYYPSVIVGFRSNNGNPAVTLLYSNTEGLSKQSTLQQQTVNYGEQSFSVWGETEQHYGAAGVSAPFSALNYNGKLRFLSTDGFLSAQTDQGLQNVLSFIPISGPIDPYVRQIKNSASKNVISAGWNGKSMWLVPNAGFDTPQQILVLDENNKGGSENGAWYTLNIPAQWIQVVSPQTSAAFVCISQGRSTYKLLDSQSTADIKGGVGVPFSARATGPMVGMGGNNAHNTWQADVQTVFYVLGLVGSITVGVNYRNQNGKIKTKKKVYDGPVFVPSTAGGFGDVHWTYANFPQVAGYRTSPKIDTNSSSSVISRDVRIPLQTDDIMNEAQWFIQSDVGYNYWQLRSVSHEGINLGVRPDLQ